MHPRNVSLLSSPPLLSLEEDTWRRRAEERGGNWWIIALSYLIKPIPQYYLCSCRPKTLYLQCLSMEIAWFSHSEYISLIWFQTGKQVHPSRPSPLQSQTYNWTGMTAYIFLQAIIEYCGHVYSVITSPKTKNTSRGNTCSSMLSCASTFMVAEVHDWNCITDFWKYVICHSLLMLPFVGYIIHSIKNLIGVLQVKKIGELNYSSEIITMWLSSQ